MEYLIEAKNITKMFKGYKANDDISIKIKKGEIYGLIGKNGAGKTTFMKILSRLTNPSSGSIIYNIDKSKIGSLIESPGFYNNMTAYENLHIKSIALGINENGYEEKLIKLVGLKNVKKKKVKDYSLGMKQRLGIAMALVGNPEFIILDEPINGLDPEGIKEIRDILLKLKNEYGVTIMISSHILDELYKIADTFCFINKGKVLEVLSKQELINKNKKYIKIICNKPNKVINILNVKKYQVINNNTLKIYDFINDTSLINKLLINKKIKVYELSVNNDNLEEFFLDLIKEHRYV